MKKEKIKKKIKSIKNQINVNIKIIISIDSKEKNTNQTIACTYICDYSGLNSNTRLVEKCKSK